MTGAQASQILLVLIEIREHMRQQRQGAGLLPVTLPRQLVESIASAHQAKAIDVAVVPPK